MRHPGLDDLVAAARVLSGHPPAARAALADRLLAEAHAADQYRKRLGRPHPDWGNGSLMGRALKSAIGRPLPTRASFQALAVMAAALSRFRREG